MAKYDNGDTVPVRGIDPNEDHPLLAIKYAEEHNLGPNDTIINTFTPDEKQKLLKMIKHKEFNQLEAAVLRALMSEAGTLEDIGAMIGSVSKKTKGAPTSKPAALKELNRILEIVAKRSEAKFGKEIDLQELSNYKPEMKKIAEFRKKKAKAAKKYAKEQEKEFYRLLRELHAEEDKHGIPRSKWYIRKFAPSNKDISKMPQFGGKSDNT